MRSSSTDHTDGRRSCGRLAACAAAAGLLCAAALPGCRSGTPERSTVTTATVPARAGADRFEVDPGATRLWLFLRADGPLARLGHSHVITTQGLRGSVWLAPQTERTACEFELAVAALVVDDPQERARAGGEFASPLDEEARTGTREHMLGATQLDAAHAPLLRLRCRAVTPTAAGALLDMTVTLRGRDAQLQVPLRWRRSANQLQADGEFDFRQTALGIEPYSAGFGALRVADRIHARFRLVAHRQ